MHGEESLTRPSRFLREIPTELKQDVRLKGQISRATPWSGFGGGNALPRGGFQAAEPVFSLGQRVRHPKFGEGVVLNSEGSGNNARIQINFDEAGGKWLVMAYARLEAI